MTAEPVVKLCPNCGAPWELGEGGTCRWCQAYIEAGPQPDRPARHVVSSVAGQASLVPPEVDDGSSCSPFIYLILSVLGPMLSSEPAVQAYVGARPGLLKQIRALSAAVSEAGARARDAGALKSDIDNRLGLYTAEQIWIFDLAADVIAVLSVLDAMPASVRATVGGQLRSLDQEVHSHTWKKEVKKAGEGPEAFRDLRATVPHHKPNPAW
jgi:hypothetical protein